MVQRKHINSYSKFYDVFVGSKPPIVKIALGYSILAVAYAFSYLFFEDMSLAFIGTVLAFAFGLISVGIYYGHEWARISLIWLIIFSVPFNFYLVEQGVFSFNGVIFRSLAEIILVFYLIRLRFVSYTFLEKVLHHIDQMHTDMFDSATELNHVSSHDATHAKRFSAEVKQLEPLVRTLWRDITLKYDSSKVLGEILDNIRLLTVHSQRLSGHSSIEKYIRRFRHHKRMLCYDIHELLVVYKGKSDFKAMLHSENLL